MSSYTGHLLMLSSLPIMTGIWIGVIGMGRARRDGAWWWMTVGLGIQSTMTLIEMVRHFASGSFFELIDPITDFAGGMGAWAISNLGSLIFAIGFALLGWQAGRKKDRITELELMNLAQATELERLRNR